jgi:hypothetical protein
MPRVADLDRTPRPPLGPDRVAGAAHRQAEDIQPRTDVTNRARNKDPDLIHFARVKGRAGYRW